MKNEKVLKDVLEEQGRTQSWLLNQLKEKGFSRDRAIFSLYCNGHRKPRDRYVLDLIAELLEVENEIIYECFKDVK